MSTRTNNGYGQESLAQCKGRVVAIKKCPNCGFDKTQPTRFSALPRFLTFLLPLQVGECVKCQRPRIRMIGYQIPVRLLIWILILGSCFVFESWVGMVRPLAAQTFMKQLSQYRIQKLILPNMMKEADEKAVKDEEVGIERLKQELRDIESKLIQYKKQFASLESELGKSNLKDKNKETANNSNRTQTDIAIEDEIQIVLKSLERWRLAWQSQNVGAYLSHYTDAFKNSNGKSRKAWLKDRQVRLTTPKKISVTIDKIRLKKLDNHIWEAIFRQTYQSEHYKDVVTKMLTLKKSGNQYLINWLRVFPLA